MCANKTKCLEGKCPVNYYNNINGKCELREKLAQFLFKHPNKVEEKHITDFFLDCYDVMTR